MEGGGTEEGGGAVIQNAQRGCHVSSVSTQLHTYVLAACLSHDILCYLQKFYLTFIHVR